MSLSIAKGKIQLTKERSQKRTMRMVLLWPAHLFDRLFLKFLRKRITRWKTGGSHPAKKEKRKKAGNLSLIQTKKYKHSFFMMRRSVNFQRDLKREILLSKEDNQEKTMRMVWLWLTRLLSQLFPDFLRRKIENSKTGRMHRLLIKRQKILGSLSQHLTKRFKANQMKRSIQDFRKDLRRKTQLILTHRKKINLVFELKKMLPRTKSKQIKEIPRRKVPLETKRFNQRQTIRR